MGRIEEAMRRSSLASSPDREPVSEQASETFVSPWAFREPVAPRAPEPRGNEPRGEVETFPPPLEPRSKGELTAFRGFHPEWLPKLVSGPSPDTFLVEQFRQLAATLHHAQSSHNVRIVMVTSAEPSEGKSLTAINLALTLSDSYGRKVLLIDGDLRRPSLHHIAQLPNSAGLSDMLKADSDQKVPVYRISDKLTLSPAGRSDSNPMSALTSARMQQIMHDAARRFDWVILDAPPLGPIADTNLLAPMTDGALLVVRAGRTHYAHVQKAIESIGRERILGVVLNGVAHEDVEYRQYYQPYDAVDSKG